MQEEDQTSKVPKPGGLTILKVIADAHPPDARLQKEINTLEGAGHTVHVACWDRVAQDSLPAFCAGELGNVYRLKKTSPRGHSIRFGFNLFAFYRYVIGIARRVQPDVLHVHSVQALPVGVVLRETRHLPLVYDAHEVTEMFGRGISPVIGRVLWFLERGVLRYVDLLITVSEGLRERYVKEVRPGVECIALLNCLSVPQDPAPRKLPGTPLVLGRIGTLRPRSRIDMIADIVVALNESGTPVRFKYAGESRGRYAATVADSQERMAEFTHFVGWVSVDNFEGFYADVDVLLNIHERGDPLVERLGYFSKVFEAMAFGVPAVINDYPSMTPIITGADSGTVVSDFSIDGFVQAIRALAEDPQRVLEMGKNAHAVGFQHYNWDVMGERLVEAYRGLARRCDAGRTGSSGGED